MTRSQIAKMAKNGASVRKISKESGMSRKDVEAILAEEAKKPSKKTKPAIIIAAVVTLIAAIAIVFIATRPQGNQDPWKKETFRGFLNEREDAPAKAFRGDLEKFIPYGEERNGWIEEMYVTGEDIPAIQSLKERFSGEIALGLFSQNKVFFSDKEGLKAEEGAMVIAFFDAEDPTDLSKLSGGALFMYDREKGAIEIMVGGISKVWFQSLLIHEMIHANRHMRGLSPELTKDRYTDAYLSEEVFAHEGQRDYLNAATNGAYQTAVQKVLARIGAKSLQEVWEKLRTEDLDEIDATFERSSRVEARVRLPQYVRDLAHYWLAERYSGEELRAKEIEAFREISAAPK